MDIRNSLAAQAYSETRRAAANSQSSDLVEGSGAAFLQTFADVLDRGEATARAAMTGKADPHALVEALASSQMAVDTVVTLRDKVVEAYQEILRMPV